MARVVVTVGLAAGGSLAGALWPGPEAEVPAAVAAIVRTGWFAAIFLLAALAVRPLRRGWPPAMRWRRALGLGAAVAAAGHVLTVASGGWLEPLTVVITEPQMRSGATAALVLGSMAATSSPWLLRRLRLGHWTLLHRAVYAAALLVVHHVALSSHAAPWAVVALGSGTGLLLLLRVRLRA